MADTANIGKLIVDLLLKDGQFTAALSGAESKVGTAMPSMQKTASSAMKIISTSFKVAAASVTALAAATTVVGSKFEQQMSTVAGILDITSRTSVEYLKLTGKARELGATTAFTATQAANGMEELARAGLTVDQIMQSSEVSLKMAGAANITLGASAKIVAASMAQFGLEAKDTTHISDVLTVATQKSLFSMTDLAEAMKFAGPVGSVFGKDIIEVTAAVSQFRDMGMEGTMAGTQFRMMMAMASKPTRSAEQALKKYGLTINDINPEVKSFKEIVLAVGEAGVTAADSFKIFGRRAGGAVAAIAKKMTSSSAKYDGLVDAMTNSAGRTEETYDIMMDNIIGNIAILRSVLEETMLVMFETYRQPLMDLLGSMIDFVKALAVELGGQTDLMSGNFVAMFRKVEMLIRDNTESGVQNIAELIVSLQEIALVVIELLPTIVSVGKAVGSIAPYVDELLILFGTVWATVKVYSLVSAIVALIPALEGATIGVGLFAGALTVSTGGMIIVAAAAVTLAAGLAVLARKYIFARQAATELARQQEVHAKNVVAAEDATNDVIVRQLEVRKKAIKRQLSDGTTLTDSQRKEMESILNLTDAYAIREYREGRLVSVGSKLMTTQEALALSSTRYGSEVVSGTEAIARKVTEVESAISRLKKDSERASPKDQEMYIDLINQRQLQLVHLEQAIRDAASAQDDSTESDRKAREEMDAMIEANRIAEKQTLDQKNALSDRESANEAIAKLMQRLHDEEAKASLDKISMRKYELKAELVEIKRAFLARIAAGGLLKDEMTALARQEAEARALAEQAAAADIEVLQEEERARREKIETEKAEALKAELERRAKLAETILGYTRKEASGLERLEIEKQEALRKIRADGATQQQQDAVAAAFDGRAAGIRLNAELRAQDILREMRGKHLSKIEQLERETAATLAEVEDASGRTRMKIIEEHNKALRKIRRDGVTKVFLEAAKAAAKFGSAIVEAGKAGMKSLGGLLDKLSGFKFSLNDAVSSIISTQDESGDASAVDTGEAARSFIDDLVTEAVRFVETLATAIPYLLGRLASQLPVLFKAITAALPLIAAALVDAIPELITAVIDALPDLLDALIDGLVLVVIAVLEALPDLITQLLTVVLPRLFEKLAVAIPKIIMAIVTAIPLILDAIIEGLPILLTAIIDAIPPIVLAVVEAIPTILTAILTAIPDIIGVIMAAIPEIITMISGMMPDLMISLISTLPSLLIALVTLWPRIVIEIVKSFPAILESLWDGLVKFVMEGIPDIARALWKAITGFAGKVGDIFKSKEKRKAARASAYSGIDYVPSTMRMTVHQGEAVVPADRNAATQGGGPAPAGASAAGLRGVSGGQGGQQSVEVTVMAEGRMLDAVQADAMRLGKATKLKRAIKRASGMSIGLNRGKFNAWNG